jgi:hypothetical protein
MKLKLITTKNKDLQIPDVEEFTAGKKYFYVRREDGQTLSISRNVIINAYRKTLEGIYKKIYLKQFKKR